ncbi:hypothetical protein HYS48_01540, partial [Candidatus Woesearchaeota archaeon]|nr:hypothetical protein [Candidatus Woesearchaeota archaeon]
MQGKAAKVMAVAFLLLFVISCGPVGGPSIGLGRDDTGRRPDYRTGTQGLVLQFLSGTPPPKLYEGDPLPIVVEVSNKGTFDVVDGRLYISGFDDRFIKLNRDVAVLSELAGKSLFNPDGLFSEVFEFEDPSVTIPEHTDLFPQAIKATACYRYQTRTTAEVCIDPDPHSIRLVEKVCQVRPISYSGGQGAPIAITSVEEEITRDRLQFKILVQDGGGGTVIAPDASILNCHEGIDRRDIDKVAVVSVEFSGHEIRLNCEPNPIRLVNGRGYTFCTFQGNLGDDAFLTALNIMLEYGYR